MWLAAIALGATPHSAHLSALIVHSPPRSKFAARLYPNGSSIPAGGAVWPTAIYWSFVQVGTPPLSVPACIDSGSGDLDVEGAGCDGCVFRPPNIPYDHSKSSTSSAVFPYTFSNTYETCDLKEPTAPCTISGSLYSDQVSLAGLGPVSVELGAIEKQTTNFDQFKEIDGVIGFTGGGKKNVFAQLVAAGKSENVWAMCMNNAGAKSNGTLTIGGVDLRLSSGPVRYVPDVGSGFHSVQVGAFVLTDTVSSRSAGGSTVSTRGSVSYDVGVPVNAAAILDTGTNVLLLPPRLLKALGTAMCAQGTYEACDALWANSCVALSDKAVDAYPSLTLKLDAGLELKMHARDCLLLGSPQASAAGQYCLGIRSGGNLFIIGDTTMRNYYLVFDLAQRQIGWGDVNKGPGGCGDVEEGEVTPY